MNRQDIPRYAHAVQQDTTRPLDPAWRIYAVIAFSLVLHAVWFFLVPSEDPLQPAMMFSSRPDISYAVPVDPGSVEETLRAARSPSMFALPSRYGFNEPRGSTESTVLLPNTGLRASAQTMEPLDLQQDRSFRFAPASISSHLGEGPIRATETAAFTEWQSADVYIVEVVWRGIGGGAQVVTTFDVTSAPPWADDRPWSAVARVVTDERGWPDEVFLEKPTESKDRNAELLRLIQNLNIPGKNKGDRGRLEISYRPVFNQKEAGM